MDTTRRHDTRRPVYQFIAPGPLVGTTEAFVLQTLSTGGLSLLRASRVSSELDKRGLDQRFAYLTIPLPGSKERVTALIEVVHRELRGATEVLRARFNEMSFSDRVKLSDYLAEQDRWQLADAN